MASSSQDIQEPPGKPGITPRWTSSSKEGVGTAYHTSSKVWFTISHGILNEVYYPTIDRPQIRDLQFLITDGETFFQEERRHLTSEIDLVQRDTLGYRIESVDPEKRYRLIKRIIADPHQPCVLIRLTLETTPQWQRRLKVFAFLEPHLEIGGYGNSASRYRVAGKNILIAWKSHTHLALGTDRSFVKISCGYAGKSDGCRDLCDNFRMDWEFEKAEDGNLALTAELDLSENGETTIGLAFGDGLHAAVTTLSQSLSIPFSQHLSRFNQQWHRVCADIQPLDRVSGDHGRLYRISHDLLLAHEDKTYPGALIASASIPWGHAKGDEDLGGYHLVWTRDLVNSATGLMAAGDTVTPRHALVYLACSQRPDGGFPQNFWLDGTPYWNAIQLDEVSFPILLAWRLWQENALADFDPYSMVLGAAGYLVRMGPVTQQERWEENSGYSPSTLAANIAALICAACFARNRGQEKTARFLEDYADFLESHLEKWTVTTNGDLLPGVPKHYIRIHPTNPNDPFPNENPNCGKVEIRNRPPGSQWRFPAKSVVDAGFLELVRYGIRPPGNPLIEDSLRVVDAVLKVETPLGPCWKRYNHDGYGPKEDGSPYEGWGIGRAWPLLTGERAHYELAAGRDVRPFILALERFATQGGMLPEQIWDQPDVPEARMFLGHPAGSAMPLMWAHAEYIKLLRSTADRKVWDLVDPAADRYLRSKGRKDIEIWKPNRRVRNASPDQVWRIQAAERFQLHWTLDEWKETHDTKCQDSGIGIYYLDIQVPRSQKAPIRFTFYWPDRDEWEGQDYAIDILQ